MRQAWSRSIKRWLIENRSRLTKSAKQLKRYVIDDAIDCQHLPLDLGLRGLPRALPSRICGQPYLKPDDVMSQNFEKLMAKWAEESREEALA
jgi:hypothetical protein